MLSIVIPTHRRIDLLRACLHAVVQHAPIGSEIVVVDDASPAGVASALALEFKAKAIRLDRQSGFAVAANLGIRSSQGDIVELLNDDTEVQAAWADAAQRWFDDPTIGAVAPLVLAWPGGRTIDSAGDCYYIGGVARKRGHGQPSSETYSQPCRVFGAGAVAGFYRREAIERVGLFPESFGSYFEDVDLAFRLNRAGYRTMFEPASRVLHHVSASFGRSGRWLIEMQSCNEERVFWRNMPNSALLRALPKHLAVLLGKLLRRFDEGSLTPWIFGRLKALWNWREIARDRDDIAAISSCPFNDWKVDEIIDEPRFW